MKSQLAPEFHGYNQGYRVGRRIHSPLGERQQTPCRRSIPTVSQWNNKSFRIELEHLQSKIMAGTHDPVSSVLNFQTIDFAEGKRPPLRPCHVYGYGMVSGEPSHGKQSWE